jgi:hypothetical protein
MSSVDYGDIERYAPMFADLQLSVYLSVLAAAGILQHLETDQRSTGSLEVVVHALKALIAGTEASYNAKEKDDSCVISHLLGRKMGDLFVNMEEGENMELLDETHMLLADMCSATISLIDRSSSTGGGMATVGSVPTVLSKMASHLTELNRALFDNLGDRHTDSSVSARGNEIAGRSLQWDSWFDPTSTSSTRTQGSAKRTRLAASRSSVLFDRNSSQWRAGAIGSKEKILASMRSARSIPLSGRIDAVVNVTSSQEEEEDVEDVDDIEEDIDDGADGNGAGGDEEDIEDDGTTV